MRSAVVRQLYAVVLIASVASVAGCAHGAHHDASPQAKVAATPAPSASASTIAAADPAQAQQQVLQAYFGLMGDWQSAAFNPADHGAGLSAHASDQALSLIGGDITRSRRDGIVAKGKLKLAPTVTSLSLTATPPVAQVDDCADTSDYLVYKAADGSPVSTSSGKPGGQQHVLAHVHEVGGVWRVYDLHIYQVGSCR
ncbi:hypothetical protein [Catenulispora pinisilvae]|uniref:hypothetical protein n=1 Tax=Catenulispora pinisilvae TaxID=2705253 RepID=UPI0018924B6F|nr:hypothetical protein [Catenulispora pinisilvae]